MKFIINKNIEEIANHIASSINKELKDGKRVLLFLSGGSSVPIEVLVSKKIKWFPSKRLTITLADERYGFVNHVNSNWYKLKKSGFYFKRSNQVPFLYGKNFATTTKEANSLIENEIKNSDYRIGVFGVGEDGHTAGIMPHSEALFIDKMVCSYEYSDFDRITITPLAIGSINEAFVYAYGKNKYNVLNNLKKDISIEEEPAQVLKKVPLLTIFTDNNL